MAFDPQADPLGLALQDRARQARWLQSISGQSSPIGPLPDPKWDAYFEAVNEAAGPGKSVGYGYADPSQGVAPSQSYETPGMTTEQMKALYSDPSIDAAQLKQRLGGDGPASQVTPGVTMPSVSMPSVSMDSNQLGTPVSLQRLQGAYGRKQQPQQSSTSDPYTPNYGTSSSGY